MSSLRSPRFNRQHHRGGENFHHVVTVLEQGPTAVHSFGVNISPELSYEVPPNLNRRVVAFLKDLAELDSRQISKPYQIPPSGSS